MRFEHLGYTNEDTGTPEKAATNEHTPIEPAAQELIEPHSGAPKIPQNRARGKKEKDNAFALVADDQAAESAVVLPDRQRELGGVAPRARVDTLRIHPVLRHPTLLVRHGARSTDGSATWRVRLDRALT